MCGCKDNVASEGHHSPDSFGLAQYMVSFQSSMEKSSAGVPFLPKPDVLFHAISALWTEFEMKTKFLPLLVPSMLVDRVWWNFDNCERIYHSFKIKKKITKQSRPPTGVEFLNI